ncbi:hypothetical protein TL18_05375 [Methanobrevibacter sp. YE315]|uniref:DUF2115 family protein n=1 Tax=Methanobrevibacter sp. YE315 TaxID=1609968 RepID=UPI000764E33B|nr:DUF2115 family protein [Methanobrevibacter sp. YE315]AMD17499.1 hypothetical protein TL18_05375 [Methanobrevibacter sp. YE315]
MKASKLLKIIRENLKDYPIEYLRNKVTDERYRDPLTKQLAKYNSSVYDDIYSVEISEDFEINDDIIRNIRSDIGFYFDRYSGGDDENKRFTENISLYLALIAKRPLHPYSEDKKDDVYYFNGDYYCKGRMKYIHDKKSLCRYCVCKTVGFSGLF